MEVTWLDLDSIDGDHILLMSDGAEAAGNPVELCWKATADEQALGSYMLNAENLGQTRKPYVLSELEDSFIS